MITAEGAPRKTCNGRNHPSGCNCAFRGGHATVQPPRWYGWRARTIERYLSGPNANCPECHAACYYVRLAHGGGGYFDCFGPPWTKHPCTDASKKYSPFNREGIPKLRNRRSEFECNGWVPLVVRNVEDLAMGTLIHGVAMNNPAVLHFGFFDRIVLDKQRPTFFRVQSGREPRLELNYFPAGGSEPVSAKGFEDCRSELELLLHRP